MVVLAPMICFTEIKQCWPFLCNFLHCKHRWIGMFSDATECVVLFCHHLGFWHSGMINITTYYHTWYLSPAPPAVLVEKISVMWRNFPHNRLSCGENLHMTDCHVENYLHMVNVEKNLSNRGIFDMKNVDTNQFCHNLHCLVAKSDLLQFTLFCREICFVAIYALLCGEKLNQKLCLWRKKDKYQVCFGWYRVSSAYSA